MGFSRSIMDGPRIDIRNHKICKTKRTPRLELMDCLPLWNNKKIAKVVKRNRTWRVCTYHYMQELARLSSDYFRKDSNLSILVLWMLIQILLLLALIYYPPSSPAICIIAMIITVAVMISSILVISVFIVTFYYSDSNLKDLHSIVFPK